MRNRFIPALFISLNTMAKQLWRSASSSFALQGVSFLAGISVSFHIVTHHLMQGAGTQGAVVSCESVSGDRIAPCFVFHRSL